MIIINYLNKRKKEDTKTLTLLKKRLGNGSIDSLEFQVKSYFNNLRILKREKKKNIMICLRKNIFLMINHMKNLKL